MYFLSRKGLAPRLPEEHIALDRPQRYQLRQERHLASAGGIGSGLRPLALDRR